ncbi:YfaP family protein [Yeosuana sp. AK3]
MKKSIVLFLLMTFFVTNCSKDGRVEDPKLLELPDVSVIDVNQDSSFDLWVLGKEDYFFIKANSSLTYPEKVLYHSFDLNRDFSIFFNSEGLVDKVVYNHTIFVFRNFNGNFVDLGVVYENGDVEIFREIETPNYNWETGITSKNASTKNTLDFRSELVRWTGHAIAGIPCALSVAAALPTGGVSLITSGITCGMFLNRLVGDIMETDFGIENNLEEFVTTYDIVNTSIGCLTLEPLECAHGVISLSYDWIFEDYEEIQNLNNEISLVEGVLENGYGDIQVTLTWDNGADIDLHVIDTNGEEIYYAHPYSNSGGILDVDDIDGYGPENIFWPANQAPNGNYQVFVHDYADNGNGTTNYTVLINAFGKTKKYTGSVVYNEIDYITSFSPNGFTSRSIVNPKTEITTLIVKN